MIIDTESFIVGLQLGRRIKMWDTHRTDNPPVPNQFIITESGDDILTESGENIMTE